jgi:hypothetical protein
VDGVAGEARQRVGRARKSRRKELGSALDSRSAKDSQGLAELAVAPLEKEAGHERDERLLRRRGSVHPNYALEYRARI